MIDILKHHSIYLTFILCCMSSGFLFLRDPLNPLSALPLGLGLLGLMLSILVSNFSISILVVLIGFWSLVIDDVSQVAWGRDYEAFTEILGKTLFESFGISGMELIVFIFACLAVYKVITKQTDFSLGTLYPLVLVASAFFTISFVSMLVGVATGGELGIHFIQRRFAHILPLTSIIGFVFLHERYFKYLSVLSAVAIVMKSFQAILIYYLNRSIFVEAEYLVDHYYSMFCVWTLSIVIVFLLQNKKWPIWMKGLVVMAQVPLVGSFILNDRRTSYVAIFLSVLSIISSLSKDWVTKNFKPIVITSLMLLPIIVLGFVGPGSLGFFREPVLSVFTEGGEVPSYRDLENANLFNAIASQPLTGLGTGKEFIEIFPMPDISKIYDRYRMIPHNLILASWAYGGPLAIAAMGLIFTFALALGTRLVLTGKYFYGIPMIVFFIQYLAFTYADLAFQIPRNQFFAGLLLGAGYRCLKI